MSVRKKHIWTDCLYFVTITCYKWIPLFEITNYYQTIYHWFDILKSKRIKICGYVVMPNHLHAILFLPNILTTIDKVIGNWKRFMAYDIVKKLQESNNVTLLRTLSDAVSAKEKLKGKKHQIFEISFDAKVLVTQKFVWQKLNYIHMNPVSKKWHLAKDYLSYPYSSARFYEDENYDGYMITHYNEIFDE